MLERLAKVKKPLNAVLADKTEVNNLTSYEWKTVEEYVEVLKPFEEATRILSATRYPTASMTIPVLNGMP